MSEYVLDTDALRNLAFAHPKGVDILLRTLGVASAYVPPEVYNLDDDDCPLADDEETLSELARGLRFARRRLRDLPPDRGRRYLVWLENAAQIQFHFAAGKLIAEHLTVEELLERELLREQRGIGRGEAACLVLVRRLRAIGVFVSSDEPACKVAARLGLGFLTLEQTVEAWVASGEPSLADLDALLQGMRDARFGLKPEVEQRLRSRLRQPSHSVALQNRKVEPLSDRCVNAARVDTEAWHSRSSS